MRLLSLLALSATALASSELARPRPRSYHTHAYYVLELAEGSTHEQAARAASSLGAELVEQVGQLRDHYLVRAHKRAVERRDGSGEDAVMARWSQRKRRRRAADPLVAARSLERQVIRKRAKRHGTGPVPLAARQETSPAPDDYLAALARRFDIRDPIWNQQWHLANDDIRANSINVTGVWAEGTTGEGIRIAIVDDGLDMHSDDLKANFVRRDRL